MSFSPAASVRSVALVLKWTFAPPARPLDLLEQTLVEQRFIPAIKNDGIGDLEIRLGQIEDPVLKVFPGMEPGFQLPGAHLAAEIAYLARLQPIIGGHRPRPIGL
jgi:hypothetical protein